MRLFKGHGGGAVILAGSRIRTKEKCPFRAKPVKCKGHLLQLEREGEGHVGYMPLTPMSSDPASLRVSSDREKDPVAKQEFLCDYCNSTFWGKSAKSVSDMKIVQNDLNTWFSRAYKDEKLKARFPKVFHLDNK